MIPVLFEIGPFKVGSFGVMLVAAFLSCVFLLQRELRRMGLAPEFAVNIVFAGAVAGLIGARLYFVLEHFDLFLLDPTGLLFGGSGLTWYGGFIAGIAAVLLVVRKMPAPLLLSLDLVAPMVLIGYAIGRVGCLLSGDGDYGYPTDVPWAMSFPRGLVPTTALVHPTPIYDSLLSLSAFGVIWAMRKRLTHSGFLFSWVIFAYGVIRFITEFYRTTPKVLFGWMSMAQAISIAAVLFALTWLLFRRKQVTA
jgi:phosphatidylglycerol:prolipoprotein diacylglycerol transferase